MNRVTLTGRIANELELRYTVDQKVILSFGLAVPRDKEKTDFINLIAFSKSAELINAYCKKGDKILISGSIRVSSYETKNSEKRNRTYVVVNQVEFLETRKEKEYE